MRIVALCLLFIAICCPAVFAQQDNQPNLSPPQSTLPPQQPTMSVLDSVVLATKNHQKFVADSIAMQYIKAPDSAMYRQFVQRTLKENLYTGKSFLDIHTKIKSTV